MYYTGVGTRLIETDSSLYELLVYIGSIMCDRGFVLRSGGATGCDTAFEQGCNKVDQFNKEIYYPWLKYGQDERVCFTSIPKAMDLGRLYCDHWHELNGTNRKIHARNIHQVLGRDLKTPSKIVICYTKDGVYKGGTVTAMNTADRNGIPVVNLGDLAYKGCSAKEIIEEIERILA